ncbi:membrane protein US14 [Human betaherpesvirus 5]|uniref:Membrane protein US14 n=1 Tax=Human cytomegalovirus TaxID=10359 RepID=D2K544_HCMV|nr:membrane protein US14 [Human betaherpesvirus 5]WNA13348.1 membrane protein US14 [Cytomegalovirus humanbeta5]AFR55970.1 membrane protein US14 [Human betaherpesvirus 5]AFR56138.1 membrane protein US14 [Human betaherpesvirus 5]AHJ82870.1 membrane protein US14 [Human betaherpesvirus 5]
METVSTQRETASSETERTREAASAETTDATFRSLEEGSTISSRYSETASTVSEDAVCWLRRTAIVMRVYGLLTLETAFSVLISALVWLGYPSLGYECSDDPSPLLLSCTPVLVLGALELTDHRHPSNGLVFALYVALLSFTTAGLNLCATAPIGISSLILTWTLFVACNGVAWEHRLSSVWRDALFTSTLLTVMVSVLASTYTWLHKTLLCLYTVFVGCILAVLFQDVRYIATKMPVSHVIRSSLILYATETLIYHTTLLMLTPVVWSARWDQMFSYLAKLGTYHHYLIDNGTLSVILNTTTATFQSKAA